MKLTIGRQKIGESEMFMSIRRYRIGEGQRDEVVRMVDEGWTDHLRKEPGFLSYHLVATDENELISMTACLDEDTLSASSRKAASGWAPISPLWK